ncbi:hypothetical protein ACJX0J_014439, partial [Zea mays]
YLSLFQYILHSYSFNMLLLSKGAHGQKNPPKIDLFSCHFFYPKDNLQVGVIFFFVFLYIHHIYLACDVFVSCFFRGNHARTGGMHESLGQQLLLP